MVEIDQALRIDVTLTVGSLQETVKVRAEAAAINTESGAKG